MKNKITAVLFIVVFLLVVAVVFTFFSSWKNDGPDVSADPTVPSSNPEAGIITYEPTNVPTQSIETPVPTTANTPVPTPPPAETPTPTPTPTPAQPVFTGSDLGSGSFSSDTGAKLNIHADWSAKTVSDSQAEVTVTVYLDSYSLHLQAVPNSVNINLGGQYVSLGAPEVDYDGSAAITTELASKTFTVDLSSGESESYSLSVEWHFGGTYGDVELPVVECGGTVSLSR